MTQVTQDWFLEQHLKEFEARMRALETTALTDRLETLARRVREAETDIMKVRVKIREICKLDTKDDIIKAINAL